MKYFYLAITIINVCLIFIEEYYYVLYNFFFMLPVYIISGFLFLLSNKSLIARDGKVMLITFVFNLSFYLLSALFYSLILNQN
jgi:hypothetical protein